MKKEKISNLILMEMHKKPKNTIFAISDFYDLGSRSAVKTALYRLHKEGAVYRLIDGFYAIPYFSEIIQEYSYPTIEQLAYKIAEKYVWNITPFGDNALNQVGLSTQVPVVYDYLSDGPYRQFNYSNKVIKFKHTSNRTISNFPLSLSLIIQCIKAIGEDRITEKDIKRMRLFCKKHISMDLLKDTKRIPAWIYSVLKQIDEVSKNEN